MSKTSLIQIHNPYYLEAFIDDLDEIVIKSPKNFYDSDDSFKIVNVDDGKQIKNLKIVHSDEKDNFSYSHIFIESDFIKFNNYYKIIDFHGFEIKLKFGKIVNTDYFDRIFYYDGNDLGNTYSKEKTTFKVWSPSSYKLRLKIKKDFNSLAKYYDMKRMEKGVWEVTINEDLAEYLYQYEVDNNFTIKETIDPYAKSSSSNGKYSYVIDLNIIKEFDQPYKSKIEHEIDRIIYELSVRDFTDSDEFKYRGKYAGLFEENLKDSNGKPIGIDHIEFLGVNTVQIMPIYDFATIDESRDVLNQYNWGYDPLQWMVPEGSYSLNPYDPYLRLIEVKKMINAFHKKNIDVVMDVVFNHIYDAYSYSWHILVPHYFFRHNKDLTLSNMSGTGNDVASSKKMVRKYILDVVRHWQEYFNIDGFRFDLMGLIDIETILKIEQITKSKNKNFFMYGEGWEMNSDATTKILANMNNSKFLPNIGFFNDYFRDIFKGSQWNIHSKPFAAGDWTHTHKALNAIAGSLGLYDYTKKFSFLKQSLNYVECHDNYTLYDFLKIRLNSFSEETIKKIHSLTSAIVILSQGIPFLHSGQEIFRTKNGVENSYNFPIELNRFNWEKLNQEYENVKFIKSLIELRKKYPLFRLRTINDIKKHIKIFLADNSLIYYQLEDENIFIQVIFNINEHDIEIEMDKNLWKCILCNQTSSSEKIKDNKVSIKTHGIYTFVWNKKEGK